MFRLQHQFNNIIETTQLNIDQMLEFHCHCECSKCSPHHQLQATTTASSRLIWEIFYSLVDRSLWQVAPDNLKCFIEFGLCFQLCFKLAVSLQYCTPYMIVHYIYIRWIWRPMVFCDDIWTAGPQPVLCAAWRCSLCVLTCRPAGSWIRWATGDCFKGRIT